ncbi:double-strand break repair helicase AddA [Algimonas porphyrae]|uniref:DNA 3'-5' helicase n=1 Tax=Algimonas porphyrae TaxID=1128113 RepID=A0ABQ5V3B1_9PROT|nr:double-strand break repair helicase AddA [Algimonas porphyrae]GLQ21323.1 double-strand break repair helicase AddA [Algimonas porphyrae]
MTRLTIPEATERQRDAANPALPKIVNANAGSGKTKVLVDRVSRILLQGTNPDKILCITYTRAAASEMQERLYDKLSAWSVAPDAALKDALEKLYGQPFDHIRPTLDIARVRTLFARALETPEGLKVMTIHAFCERIIQRFPIEAGIMPGFEPLDDPEVRTLLVDGRAQLLALGREDRSVRNALHHMAAAKADATIDGLIFAAARNVDRLQAWTDAGGVAPFRAESGLSPDDSVASIAEAAWHATDMARVRAVAALCQTSKAKAAQDFVARVAALDAMDDPVAAFHLYSDVFLKQDGDPRARVLVKAVTDIDPFISADSPEAARVLAAQTRIKACRIAEMSEALLTLGRALGDIYQRDKHAARGLDFNDLILKTRDLLKRRDVSEWVAYKLDGGIDHVLLDEAQDTSPEQWEIIDALTQDFRQDSPDRDGPDRAFFAVGDPKQSIYRFQGAAPEIFMDSVRTRTAPGDSPVELRMSFRSAQQVLDVVDALFLDQGGLQAMFDADARPEPTDLVRHDAARQDPGLVELWPLTPKAEAVADREPWDTTPVDAQGDGDPRVRLAREMASTIAHWIESGEAVFDRKLNALRPIHAGDVLILVQKRIGGLFNALIKALKDEGLPVAGADRLVLQEALIVRDLLALTRFVLLPQDDLSLAEALKSPLFGLDDEALFSLCVDREGTLWEAVQSRDPALTAALNALQADGGLAPYEFYARLLDRVSPQGLTYREALLRRLGLESREALDAFLSIALSHQQREAPSLQRFLQAFTANDVEIKRDKDPAGRDVRVMTVHGAKGLEAPVVFLPDTTRAPRASSGGLIKAGESYILAPSSTESTPLVDRYKAENDAEELREYMRLLYVAMTRAESRLVVCGYFHGRNDPGYQDGSWYDWVARTLRALDGTAPFATPFDISEPGGLRYGSRPDRADARVDGPTVQATSLPDWIHRAASPEIAQTASASPSTLLTRTEPVGSSPGGERFIRGILIHRLLEILPDHAPAQRTALAEKMLADHLALSQADRTIIQSEVFAVLDDPAFAPVFAPGSRAEVSLSGRVRSIRGGSVALNAQVDRLNVTDDTVYLVDYKSNRTRPETDADIDIVYLAQMAAYRELAQAIWPDHTIRCGLLWTHGPRLTWLHDNAMDAALTAVNTLPTS